MHYEYAVEPAAIGSSWETFRYIFEKFGFQKGRLISRFPKTWPLLVIEAASEAGIGDLALKRIVEKLRQGKRTALIRMGRSYDPALGGWIENAVASHSNRPFHGVIAQDAKLKDAVVSPAELDDDHPLMVAPTSRDVPRTATDIAHACFLLLYAAREINLVDPYLNFVSTSQDYRGPLEQMMHALHIAGKESVTIRIHYRAHHTRPTQTEILQDTQRWVNVAIPKGYELHLYAWEQRQAGEDLHDRFLLCDCGGMMVGAGFAASRAGENVTFTLLDDAHAQGLRSRFADGSTIYAQVGSGVRVQSNGEAEFV